MKGADESSHRSARNAQKEPEGSRHAALDGFDQLGPQPLRWDDLVDGAHLERALDGVGAATWPGHGVNGGSGYIVARQLLRE